MPIASPSACPIGKSFKYDLPTIFDAAFWTGIPNRASTQLNDTAVVIDGAYSPSHIDDDPLTFFSGNDYGASQETAALDFEELSIDLVLHYFRIGATGGSHSAAMIEIDYGIKINTYFQFLGGSTDPIGLGFAVSRWDNTLIYSSTAIPISGTGDFTFDGSANIRVTKSAGGGAVYNVWINDVQVVFNYDATTVSGSLALGDQKIYLSSIFFTYDEPPAVNRRLWWIRYKNIYLIGTGFPSTCLGDAPTKSSILPSSTGKISHARILKGHKGVNEATAFHNAMRGAV